MDDLPNIVRRPNRLAVRFMNVDGAMDTISQVEPRNSNGANTWIFRYFTPEFRAELEARGYDLKTMRFHIDRKSHRAKIKAK